MKKILLEQIKQDLRQLQLRDMAEALESLLRASEKERCGYLSFLSQLLSTQLKARTTRSVERRIKKAGLSTSMSFENYDWNFQPSLNVEYVKDLSQLGFIANRQNLLILGKIGTGKTHLAKAFGIRACEAGYKVEFYTLQSLLKKLYATLAGETTDEIIAHLTKVDLLIIDALGFIRPKPEYPSLLLDLVRACHHRTCIILTSNISFQEWGETMGNPSITTAIVDRILYKACLININPGRSYRTEGPHSPMVTQDNTTSATIKE